MVTADGMCYLKNLLGNLLFRKMPGEGSKFRGGFVEIMFITLFGTARNHISHKSYFPFPTWLFNTLGKTKNRKQIDRDKVE